MTHAQVTGPNTAHAYDAAIREARKVIKAGYVGSWTVAEAARLGFVTGKIKANKAGTGFTSTEFAKDLTVEGMKVTPSTVYRARRLAVVLDSQAALGDKFGTLSATEKITLARHVDAKVFGFVDEYRLKGEHVTAELLTSTLAVLLAGKTTDDAPGTGGGEGEGEPLEGDGSGTDLEKITAEIDRMSRLMIKFVEESRVTTMDDVAIAALEKVTGLVGKSIRQEKAARRTQRAAS